MTYYLLFLICGFFAGVMFEKNRMLKMAIERFEDFRHLLLAETAKRMAASLALSERKRACNRLIGSARAFLAMIALLFLVGCAIPMGSPMGYSPMIRPVQPVNFYIPPAAMDFATGQWQAPDAFTEFKPRTPIPRQASGMIGNQYFSTLY